MAFFFTLFYGLCNQWGHTRWTSGVVLRDQWGHSAILGSEMLPDHTAVFRSVRQGPPGLNLAVLGWGKDEHGVLGLNSSLDSLAPNLVL